MQYYSLQHRILLSSPDTSTIEHHFHFGPAASFFLEVLVIVLHSSSVAYWTPSNPGGSTFSVISFCLFIQFMGFSQQEYRNGLPFPPPVDHVLLELSTMTRLSWVALNSTAHSSRLWTTVLLIGSMSLTTLDTSYKWVSTIVVFLWHTFLLA